MNSFKKIHTAVFDFDNTLFDTELVKRKLREVVMDYGVDSEIAQKVYDLASVNGDEVTFSIEYFFEVLQKELEKLSIQVPDGDFEKLREKILEGANLLKGAKEILDKCKNENMKMYLLSLGVKKWQDEKLDFAGIRNYFDNENIVYTLGVKLGKVETLKNIFGNGFGGSGCVLFNDKPDETEAILEAFPEMKVFLRFDKRDFRYSEQNFKDLREKYSDRIEYSSDLSDFINEISN